MNQPDVLTIEWLSQAYYDGTLTEMELFIYYARLLSDDPSKLPAAVATLEYSPEWASDARDRFVQWLKALKYNPRIVTQWYRFTVSDALLAKIEAEL